MMNDFKNYFERLSALLLLGLSTPLIVLIATLIRIDSEGPIIFSQIRVGKNKKLFRFYKFRTMYKDAKKRYPKLYDYRYTKDEIKRFRFKVPDDPRLTKFGARLRKTSLDELPNLINVIKGEMALIGPRPEIPEMLKYYTKTQMKKFSVRPGITGYAQVHGRGLLTLQETIKFDLDYIKERGFAVNLKILTKTIVVVLRGIGAF